MTRQTIRAFRAGLALPIDQILDGICADAEFQHIDVTIQRLTPK
jgi:hypothetical protein